MGCDSSNLESEFMASCGSAVFFIADNSSLGLELYAWAHGEISEEWIIIH